MDVYVPFIYGKREMKLKEKQMRKKKLNIRENKGKKIISILSFVHESIMNNASYQYFCGFVDRVEDFWVTILPRSKTKSMKPSPFKIYH